MEVVPDRRRISLATTGLIGGQPENGSDQPARQVLRAGFITRHAGDTSSANWLRSIHNGPSANGWPRVALTLTTVCFRRYHTACPPRRLDEAGYIRSQTVGGVSARRGRTATQEPEGSASRAGLTEDMARRVRESYRGYETGSRNGRAG